MNLPQWDDGVTDWDQPEAFWDISRNVIEPLPVNPNTTYVAFNPSSSSNFQFQATLDGNDYIVIVTWNLFGERYYVNIYDTSQNLILVTAMVGSPNFYNISLTGATFTTQLVWRVGSGNFEIIQPG